MTSYPPPNPKSPAAPAPPLVTPATVPVEIKLAQGAMVLVTSPQIDQLRLANLALETRVKKLENRLDQLGH